MSGSFSVGSGAMFGVLNSLLAVEVLADACYMAIFPLNLSSGRVTFRRFSSGLPIIGDIDLTSSLQVLKK